MALAVKGCVTLETTFRLIGIRTFFLPFEKLLFFTFMPFYAITFNFFFASRLWAIFRGCLKMFMYCVRCGRLKNRYILAEKGGSFRSRLSGHTERIQQQTNTRQTILTGKPSRAVRT
jgi:hypothetical protein